MDIAIVSTARTPIGKAYRGAFNMTHCATLAGHAVEHGVSFKFEDTPPPLAACRESVPPSPCRLRRTLSHRTFPLSSKAIP